MSQFSSESTGASVVIGPLIPFDFFSLPFVQILSLGDVA